MIKTTCIFLKGSNIRAITIFPFILFRDKEIMNNIYTLNHEKIHYRQQLEMLVLPFFIWYIIEWLIRVIQYKFYFHEAYLNISMDREAHSNGTDLNYLKTRKWYAWLRYL